MKVYFRQNFWDLREYGCLGVLQKVDWKFSYDNQEYQIPAIYLFPEGVTIDIISLLDTAKIKSFREKYENHVKNMSEEELLYLEAVRPIPQFLLRRVYINNELAEMRKSCSACYIAGIDSDEKDDALREIQREYGFLQGEDISFQCIRVHVKFSEASQREIYMMKFLTSKTEVILPINKRFRIEAGMLEKAYEEEFVHPLSGIKHYIYINKVKEFNAREQFIQYKSDNPFHYVRVSYELAPPLPQDERLLLMEIGQPDKAVSAGGDKTIIGSACGAIGIIGKSDSELGKHGYPLETVFTKLYWKSLKSIEMSIVGIYKEKCPEEEIIVYDSGMQKSCRQSP